MGLEQGLPVFSHQSLLNHDTLNQGILPAIGLILVLTLLETILSADNAVALAALVQHMEDEDHQRQALNWGLAGAFGLRIGLIIAATWVIRFWQIELIGALYLLWLAGKYFWERWEIDAFPPSEANSHRPPNTLWQIIPLIALTDLAFSLDSVTTAVAIADQTWIILAGGAIGIITLRFLAGLFVRWLSEFTYLQDAAYLTIVGVGIKLLCKAILPAYVPPEWVVVPVIAILFSWGFSKRVPVECSIGDEDLLP
ncbi:DUF475 domain-containing protein [Alkalinema sp. FACHB-956]|uniref:TerC family protein n=1 Tax=Alkalinema sp. FACHB-956 TaxID=2692768 RepID=UPI001681DB6E|nr:DUF475 domain-containing protein [Alkalinema sp. FACHB-956]MBD2330067.1 DUF475 domain-containing protein [Alkalinema sp. FACHB-956]